MSASVRPDNINYRAEGNSGLVVGLREERTVVKLRKSDNWESSPNSSDVFKELANEIKITHHIWKLILGETFVNVPIMIFWETDEIKTLNEAVSRFRPIHRIPKSVKEEGTFISMLPDYCFLPPNLNCVPASGPVLCIEIKPKQGFVKGEYQSSCQPVSLPICTYCMMQRYKLKSGKIACKSRYCPPDLFSGCYHRMLHALKMLHESPQNNLRIFKNEYLIYSEEKRDNLNELLADFTPSENTRPLDILCDLVVQSLLKPFPLGSDKTPVPFLKKFNQNCINSCTASCKHDATCGLPQYCVLERISSCQMLDDLKITELHQLYLQVKESNDKNSDSIGCYSRSEIPKFIGETRRDANESEYEYASRKVWEFLAALTMKDCSIMITMKRLLPNCPTKEYIQNIVADKYGNSYVFSIAIADLDSKSICKVVKVHDDFTSMLKLVDMENDFKQ